MEAFSVAFYYFSYCGIIKIGIVYLYIDIKETSYETYTHR